MSLTQYWHNNTGLPINKWAHYLPIYEKHFDVFRNRSIFFLEIGTGQGGSSRMWADYFGPLAQIVTIDIREECRQFENGQIKVRIGSQDDEAFLQSMLDEFGPPDVVLDDGSHHMDHVKATFAFLFPRMAREACYFVEDMHCAYWPDYGGGLRKPGTFIEDAKAMIDELNSFNHNHEYMRAGDLPRSNNAKLIRGLHFYDSIIVIDKGPFVDMAPRSIPLKEGTIW